MTDMGDLALRAVARAHDLNKTRAEQVVRRKTVHIPLIAYGATVDLTEAAMFQVPSHVADGIQIVSLSLVPSAAVSGSNSVYRTLTVSKRDGAGGAATVCAGMMTLASGTGDADPGGGTFTVPATGNLTGFVAKAFTLSGTTSVLQLVAGGVLTLAIAHASTGTALPTADLVLVYDEL